MALLKFVGITLVLCIASFESPVYSLDMDEIIKSVCIANMTLELEKSQKKIPEEIKEDTCNCFLQELQQGYSIESAKELCKDKVTYEIIWEFQVVSFYFYLSCSSSEMIQDRASSNLWFEAVRSL